MPDLTSFLKQPIASVVSGAGSAGPAPSTTPTLYSSSQNNSVLSTPKIPISAPLKSNNLIPEIKGQTTLSATPEEKIANLQKENDYLDNEGKSISDIDSQMKIQGGKIDTSDQNAVDEFNNGVDTLNQRNAAYKARINAFNANLIKTTSETQDSTVAPNDYQKWLISMGAKTPINPATTFIGDKARELVPAGPHVSIVDVAKEVLPSISKVSDAVQTGIVSGLKSAIQEPLKYATEAGMTAMQGEQDNKTPLSKLLPTTPDEIALDPTLQAMFGTDKLQTFQKQYEDLSGTIKDAGGSPAEQKYIPPAVISSTGILDFFAQEELSGEAAAKIARSSDAEEISSILQKEIKNLSADVADALARPLVHVNTVEDVQKVIGRIKLAANKAASMANGGETTSASSLDFLKKPISEVTGETLPSPTDEMAPKAEIQPGEVAPVGQGSGQNKSTTGWLAASKPQTDEQLVAALSKEATHYASKDELVQSLQKRQSSFEVIAKNYPKDVTIKRALDALGKKVEIAKNLPDTAFKESTTVSKPTSRFLSKPIDEAIAEHTPPEGPQRVSNQEVHAGQKEETKIAVREAKNAPTALENRLDALQTQKQLLEETIAQNPAKELSKYLSKSTGRLPEVTGQGTMRAVSGSGKIVPTSEYGRTGDQKMAELGYKNPEEAQLHYENYQIQKKRLETLNSHIADTKKQLAAERSVDTEERSKNHLLNKTSRENEKKIAEIADKKTKTDAIEKRNKELVDKMAKEQEYAKSLQDKIDGAHLEEKKAKGMIAGIKKILYPIKSVDDETKKILTDWFQKKLAARELANETFQEMAPKGPQNFQEIIDYQAGSNTPYIRNALDSLGTEFQRRGLGHAWKDNYLPQVWRNTNAEQKNAAINFLMTKKGMTASEAQQYLDGKELSKDMSLRLKLRPDFVKARFWPSYEEGMAHGLIPTFHTPAQLIAWYRESGEKAVANIEVLSELKKSAKLLSEDDAPDSWKSINRSFGGKQTLYARPELAKLINGIFRDEEDLTTWEKITKFASKVSSNAQRIQLSAGLPYTNINFHSVGQAYKLIATAAGETVTGDFQGALSSMKASFSFIRSNSNAASRKWFSLNQEYITKMAQNGLSVGGHEGDYKGLYEKFSDLFPTPKGSLIGKTKDIVKGSVNVLGVVFHNAFGQRTFQNMMPMIDVQLFKDAYHARLNAGLSDEEAAKTASNLVKTYQGILGEVGRGQTTKEVLTGVAYAEQYRESVIGTYMHAVQGWTTDIKNPDFRKSRALLWGTAIAFVVYNLLNHKTSGNYMWDNPPGHEFQLRIPQGDGSVTYIEYTPGAAFLRNLGEGVFALAKGDTGTAAQKFGSTFSLPIQIGTEIATNRDYFGRPIYGDNDSLATKAGKAAAYTGLGVGNPFVLDTYKAIVGQEPIYQAAVRMTQMPVTFGSLTKEGNADYFRALDQKTQDTADTKAAFQPTFDKIQAMNDDDAQKALDALSVDDYKTYKSLKAGAAIKARYTAERTFWPTYQKIQKMNDDDAQKALDALSVDDYKTYQSLKKSGLTSATGSGPNPSVGADGTPKYNAGQKTTNYGVIDTIWNYAKAIGTDPITAFKDIFTGQTIKQVTNGTILVDRMSFEDSQTAKQEGGGDNPTMKLDHAVPLEIGGDNSKDNLQLIPTDQWEENTPVEDFLGKQLSAGTITGKKARELAIRFKAGAGEILSPALMDEYKNKYGGKPLTADEVFDYKDNL